MNKIGWIVVGIAAAVAVVALVLAGRVSLMQTKGRTITVTGQGTVKISQAAANRQVNAFLQVSDPTQAEVVAQLSKERSLTKKVLSQEAIPTADVHIHNFSVNRPFVGPYTKPGTTQQFTGSQNIQVDNLTSTAAHKLAEALLTAGVTGNINTGTTYPPHISAADRAKAEVAAVADARSQAQTVAAKMGATLGPVLKVANPPNNQNPVAYNSPEQGEITATEEVTFQLQ